MVDNGLFSDKLSFIEPIKHFLLPSYASFMARKLSNFTTFSSRNNSSCHNAILMGYSSLLGTWCIPLHYIKYNQLQLFIMS